MVTGFAALQDAGRIGLRAADDGGHRLRRHHEEGIRQVDAAVLCHLQDLLKVPLMGEGKVPVPRGEPGPCVEALLLCLFDDLLVDNDPPSR